VGVLGEPSRRLLAPRTSFRRDFYDQETVSLKRPGPFPLAAIQRVARKLRASINAGGAGGGNHHTRRYFGATRSFIFTGASRLKWS